MTEQDAQIRIPNQNAREKYRVFGLQTVFWYVLNEMIVDGFKTNNTHINVATKFSYSDHHDNRGKNYKSVTLF